MIPIPLAGNLLESPDGLGAQPRKTMIDIRQETLAALLSIDLLAQAKKAELLMLEGKRLGICRDDRPVSIAERFKGNNQWNNPNHWRGIVEDIQNATVIASMLAELAKEIEETSAEMVEQVAGGFEGLAYWLEGVEIDAGDVRFTAITGRFAKVESRALFDRIDVADALLRTLQGAEGGGFGDGSAIINCRDELWRADPRGMRGEMASV